jgi:hypothetical protein
MKLNAAALATLLVVSVSSSSTFAFVPASSKRAAVVHSGSLSFLSQPGHSSSSHSSRFGITRRNMATLAATSPLTVGIVGATGAVGKEIKYVLERSPLPVQTLRVFGSSRSAGSTMETEKFGSIVVEQFDVSKARECDVIFLAVSGDFALEHAEAISQGPDGAVVIDNSVRTFTPGCKNLTSGTCCIDTFPIFLLLSFIVSFSRRFVKGLKCH